MCVLTIWCMCKVAVEHTIHLYMNKLKPIKPLYRTKCLISDDFRILHVRGSGLSKSWKSTMVIEANCVHPHRNELYLYASTNTQYKHNIHLKRCNKAVKVLFLKPIYIYTAFWMCFFGEFRFVFKKLKTSLTFPFQISRILISHSST